MDDSDGGTAAERRRRRATALRALAQETDPASTGSPARAEALRHFGDAHELVLAVHQRWQVSLLARLDQVIEDQPADLHRAVLRAVREQSRAMPGFAALLREHADDPVLARAQGRLADDVARACPCGRPHPLVAPAGPPVRFRPGMAALVAAVRRHAGTPRLRCARHGRSRGGGLVPRRI
ncbi:hypothetical protein ACI78T_00450 [Blastococcus sp. SYSU D00922]